MASPPDAISVQPLPGAVAARRTNWSGNFTYSTGRLFEPASVAELQALVRSVPSLRALGSRHSFNAIADSQVAQVSLSHFRSMELDAAAATVTVGAGIRYGDLAPWLDARGFALHNLASLPHISVVGACTTATHGSGVANGNLSTAVSAIEFIDGTGELVHLSRAANPAQFPGAVVSLGALGIVTRITLDIVPSYQMRQDVYLDLPFAALEQNLDAIFAAGYSVSLFTDWQHSRATQVWIKTRLTPDVDFTPPPTFFGASPATRNMHPLLDHSAENSTEQRGIPGPWYERLPHFRMEFTPSSGQELQTEYFVPRAHGLAAIRAVEHLRDLITPLLFVTEFRAITADDLWLSPCYQQESFALHFTWKPDTAAVLPVLTRIEAALEPFGVRAHWAKLFTMPPSAIQSRYPRLADFRSLADSFDPHAVFRNDFVTRTLFSR